MAAWFLRAVAVDNILVRREEETLFLPANQNLMVDDGLRRMVDVLARVHRLWPAYVVSRYAPLGDAG